MPNRCFFSFFKALSSAKRSLRTRELFTNPSLTGNDPFLAIVYMPLGVNPGILYIIDRFFINHWIDIAKL